MIYQEITEAEFANKAPENFAMCLMCYKGREFVKFIKIIEIDDPSVWSKAFDILRSQQVGTLYDLGLRLADVA